MTNVREEDASARTQGSPAENPFVFWKNPPSFLDVLTGELFAWLVTGVVIGVAAIIKFLF